MNKWDEYEEYKELKKRATPMNPVKTTVSIPVLGECVDEHYDAFKCPICNTTIDDDFAGYKKPKFCYECSQALDWSEEDEKTL